jgi:hypothetical protein
MSKPESANDCAKRMIGKWETFYISLTIFNRGVQSLRQFYHPRRQIDLDRVCAAICRFGCKSAWPARDIQKTCTGAQTHVDEKGIDS